jgi:hypothetical protein
VFHRSCPPKDSLQDLTTGAFIGGLRKRKLRE